ncbi:MAG: ribose 5-phosphate isomerase A [Chloroflexota bacterium]
MTDRIDELKKQAAEKAVAQVRSGMVLGLGTGSTAVHATRAIGRLWQSGGLTDIVAIPTSEVTAQEARKFDIPLVTLEQAPAVDITIDGADEITPALDLIKGFGGALLREKIVAASSKRLIIVADDSKLVRRIATKFPVPVEVIPFAKQPVSQALESLGAKVSLRFKEENTPFITDEQNLIFDCTFENGIEDAVSISQQMLNIPGVVEHGLFLSMAQEAIVASESGLSVLSL